MIFIQIDIVGLKMCFRGALIGLFGMKGLGGGIQVCPLKFSRERVL